MKYLLTVLKYFPYVIQAVTAIEASVTAPGKTKKQLILDAILSGSKVGEGVVDQGVIVIISTLIDTVVSTLNAAGIFGKPVVKV
jgi:hypothetical protein